METKNQELVSIGRPWNLLESWHRLLALDIFGSIRLETRLTGLQVTIDGEGGLDGKEEKEGYDVKDCLRRRSIGVLSSLQQLPVREGEIRSEAGVIRHLDVEASVTFSLYNLFAIPFDNFTSENGSSTTGRQRVLKYRTRKPLGCGAASTNPQMRVCVG